MFTFPVHILRPLAIGLLIMALPAVVSVTPARAGDWTYSAGISVGETYTDNVGLVSEDEDRRPEYITTATPSFSVRGTGRRVSLNLDYALSADSYRNDTSRDSIRNSLTGSGRAELIRDFAFFDTQASISRQVVDPAGPVSQSTAGQRVNRTTVSTVNVGALLRQRFGGWVDTQLRASYTPVIVRSGQTTSSNTVRESFSATSGRKFTRFRWGLTASRSDTIRGDDAPASRVTTVNSNYTVVVNSKVSLIGSVGYEIFDDPTLRNQPDEVIWDAGIALRPGRRTSLRGTYGHRFGSETFTFDGSYQLSQRTSLSATYGETIQTSQQAIAADLSFIGLDSDGNLIDIRTGQPFSAGNTGFGLQTNSFRSKRFSAALSGSRRRNRFSLRLGWESRETDGANATGAVGAEQIVRSAGASWGRTISQRTTGNLGVNFSNTDFGTEPGRVDNHLSLTAGLGYTIFTATTANLNYTFARRDSNVSSSRFHENSVFVNFRHTF